MTSLPPIDRPLTSEELRDRALAAMNGEARALSGADQDRRRRLLARALLVLRGRGEAR